MIKTYKQASGILMLLSILLMSFMLSPVSAASTVSEIKTIDEVFKIQVNITAETSWPEGQDQPINITIKSVQMPENTTSRIVISFINVQIMQADQVIDYKAQTKTYSLNSENETVSTVIELSPPVVDSFHLNVTIIGNTEIGGTQSPQFKIDVSFPKEGSIIVLREELKPLIQLYGFPDATSFWMWFRIFLVPLTVIMIQFVFIGSYIGYKKYRSGKK